MLKIWLNGRLVPKDEAKVSVYDHGLLYGDGVFEGIRVYGGRIFKMGAHLDRLFASAERIRLAPPFTREQFASAMRETLAANNLRDAYIRLVITRGEGSLGLNPFKCPKAFAFIIADEIHLYPKEMYEKGMKVITAKRPRIDIAALDPAIKSLNYLNNILAKVEALDQNLFEAVMLNSEGYVSECTGDNIFFVKNGEVATPELSAGILHGVTRNFVIRLCRDLGIRCTERLFRLDELKRADEVFLTGTAAEIISVTQIDEAVIGQGRPGPVTGRLTAEFVARTANKAAED